MGLRKLLIDFKYAVFDLHARKSYSQEGEDLLLYRLLDEKAGGFYVDVGAHHPKRFSNTCFFYQRGWHGINIDAMPGSMKRFHRARKRDINVEVAISAEPREIRYFMFNEPALNGFDEKMSLLRDQASGRYRLIGERLLRTRTLADVLDEHLPENQGIDFMNVDVEGLDLDVLKSNNWTRYRPAYVLVESLESPLESVFHNEIGAYLGPLGYVPWAKAYNTVFYKKME